MRSPPEEHFGAALCVEPPAEGTGLFGLWVCYTRPNSR
jgi:hypothetical protein